MKRAEQYAQFSLEDLHSERLSCLVKAGEYINKMAGLALRNYHT
jgi:hypothetical protein